MNPWIFGSGKDEAVEIRILKGGEGAARGGCTSF